MCSSKVQSILQRKSIEALKTFNWDIFISEIEENAPTLYQLLLSCTKTRKPRPNRKGVICMTLAMLLKFRFHNMDLLHKIVALIMYAGHCEKQV